MTQWLDVQCVRFLFLALCQFKKNVVCFFNNFSLLSCKCLLEISIHIYQWGFSPSDGCWLLQQVVTPTLLITIIVPVSYLHPTSPPDPLRQARTEGEEDVNFSSGWRGFLSSMGLSIPAGICRLATPALRVSRRRMLQGKPPDIPEHVLRLAGVGPEKLRAEWSLSGFITMFLPEFPHRTVPGQEHFQVEQRGKTTIYLVCGFV